MDSIVSENLVGQDVSSSAADQTDSTIPANLGPPVADSKGPDSPEAVVADPQDVSGKGRKPGKKRTPTFTCTFKFRYSTRQCALLDEDFHTCYEICNAFLDDRKMAAEQLLAEHPEFPGLNKEYRTLRFIEKTDKLSQEQRQRKDELLYLLTGVRQEYGLDSAYTFHKLIRPFQPVKHPRLGAQIFQKLADRVFEKVDDYLCGAAKNISRFLWSEFQYIEGNGMGETAKCRAQTLGIHLRAEDTIVIGNPQRAESLKIRLDPKLSPFQRACLEEHRIKYIGIKRLPWRPNRRFPGGWLYQAVIVFEGTPPPKIKKGTNEPKHPLGEGRVGLDIGPQTLAVVGHDNVMLCELADRANEPWARIRRLQRAMDRSRRATNPRLFYPDGTVIPKNKLPPELLDKDGKRRWCKSKRYRTLLSTLHYELARLARVRRNQHLEMANRLLAFGNEFYVEQMNWRGLAKRAKPKAAESAEAADNTATADAQPTLPAPAAPLALPLPQPILLLPAPPEGNVPESPAEVAVSTQTAPPPDADVTAPPPAPAGAHPRQSRRSRFGKSIANKAPALFLTLLAQKVLAAGGSFNKIRTSKAKASQYNHITGKYKPKKLSERWQPDMPDGLQIQRDLYSAFLIMNSNAALDGFEQALCESSFDRFVALHDLEIARLRSGAVRTVSSMGIKPSRAPP